MESMHAPQRRTPKAVAAMAAICVLGVAAAGCGSDDDYKNELRPPSPIIVTAAIARDHVTISPREFGAGPISLIVTNQTDDTQQVTLETSDTGGGRGLTQQTGPINPSDTATLQADIPEGTYEVGVAAAGIRPAKLVVGEKRPSAQNDLLQP
jgi:hypothetical protein